MNNCQKAISALRVIIEEPTVYPHEEPILKDLCYQYLDLPIPKFELGDIVYYEGPHSGYVGKGSVETVNTSISRKFDFSDDGETRNSKINIEYTIKPLFKYSDSIIISENQLHYDPQEAWSQSF